jgi:hypothetical protein
MILKGGDHLAGGLHLFNKYTSPATTFSIAPVHTPLQSPLPSAGPSNYILLIIEGLRKGDKEKPHHLKSNRTAKMISGMTIA